MLKEKKREVGEFNASSMADITFLLLVFFLVTTTVSSDKGIKFVLPPKVDNPEESSVKVRGVVNIMLDENNNILLGKTNKEEEISIHQVRDQLVALKREIEAEGDSIIVSIKTHANSNYKNYIDVIDQVKNANISRISLAQ